MSVDELVRTFQRASIISVDVHQIVDNALGCDRSVMFVHVDWAMTTAYHRKYAEFVVNYHNQHPDDPLMFHFVDVTSESDDYAPLRSIPGWKQLMSDAGTALIHGHGEIAWIENGRVLRVQRITDFRTPEELIELTERVTPPNG